MVCQKCGRRLKDVTSIERGYGPVCWKTTHRTIHRKIKANSEHITEDANIPGQMSLEDYPGMIPEQKEG